MSYLQRPSRHPIGWAALARQFGPEYAPTRQGLYNFRTQFMRQLSQVLLVYPSANVEVSTNGVLLWPSKTHVGKRILRTAIRA